MTAARLIETEATSENCSRRTPDDCRNFFRSHHRHSISSCSFRCSFAVNQDYPCGWAASSHDRPGSPPLPDSRAGASASLIADRPPQSAPSAAVESKAVGYCLYRSKTPTAAKQNPICSSCEQINSKPIVGTGCVDDLVEDGADYYYVVTAINANGRISSSSNETPAQIPRNQSVAKSVPASTYPACREPQALP
jgi:hypothetical protein